MLFIALTFIINVVFQISGRSSSYPNEPELVRRMIQSSKEDVIPYYIEYSVTDPHTAEVNVVPPGEEVRHFLFLKIHKAASGTATSVFFRFGITRNLTFALPRYYNIIHQADSIKENYIFPRLKQSFDIINSHMIYERGDVAKFLPKDAVYIGILRDPFQQFKSSVNYMQPPYIYNLSKTSPVHEYLKDPSTHERKNINGGPKYSWVNNRQAVEFGFPDHVVLDKTKHAIYEYIEKLDKDFHLVLIAEYFDESMILMRRMLNWKIKDVLYTKKHVRGWDRQNTLPQGNDRVRLRDWLSVDYALYDFFYKRFWRQVEAAGNDFFEEVLYFKGVRSEVEDFCSGNPNSTSYYRITESVWTDDIIIDQTFCELLTAEETDFLIMIAKYQYGMDLKFD